MLDTIKDNVNIRRFVLKTFLNIIGEVHFNELERRICHLSAASRGKGRNKFVFWSGKNRIWSGKSQGILLLTEGGHPVTLVWPKISEIILKGQKTTLKQFKHIGNERQYY